MLGRKFKQQSVIVGTPKGVFEYDKFGNIVTKFKNSPALITDKDAESYMTQLIGKGERAFKFELDKVTPQNLEN
jgi:hypothetical protein